VVCIATAPSTVQVIRDRHRVEASLLGRLDGPAQPLEHAGTVIDAAVGAEVDGAPEQGHVSASGVSRPRGHDNSALDADDDSTAADRPGVAAGSGGVAQTGSAIEASSSARA
jgi:hypothetical protein